MGLAVLFVKAILIALVIWTISILFYRIALHPLRSYPGPFICRVSGVPTLFHAWKGDLHYQLYRLHYQYGENVRYSPNKLSINNAQALNDIYGFNKNTSKPEEFYSAFRLNKHAVNTFNTSSKLAHRRKRRIMGKAFTIPVLTNYESFIAAQVGELAQKLNGGNILSTSSQWRVFNMAHEFNCLMLDIMGGLCFGEAFGFLAGKGDAIMPLMHQRAVRIYMTGHEPLLKRYYLDILFFPRLFRATSAVANYAQMCTSRRIERYRNTGDEKVNADDETPRDILTNLLDSRDDETHSTYSENELLGEAILLMMGGSDTTATASTATLFYVLRHPEVLKKLRVELAENFSTAGDIQQQRAENCPYLRACVDEAMRLSPPSPTNIPRLVGPGGIRVTHQDLSEGVYVGVPNFALFRNKDSFDDPHAFIPERWIANSRPCYTEESVKRARAAFNPFSLGPRQCIGKTLAIKEVLYIMANVFYLFDIELIGDSGKLSKDLPGAEGQVILEQFDAFTSLENGPSVRIKVREGVKF